jgi:predicted 3-demethylubiquinone-9 3-methyltransferase (glyoxalase superfamily)
VPKLIPNLWFDDNGLEAAEFYTSVFPNSKVLTVTHYTEAGPGEPGAVLSVDFELDGQKITAINGGPMFTFSEAVSLAIECADQAEIDHYWDALTADGGQESQCGWLKDRYGFSWQVVPEGWERQFDDADPERTKRVMEAMFQMQKLDIAALQAAADAV